MSTRINVGKLQEGLRARLFGKYIYFTREVSSTNDWARELADLGAPEGTATMAETQTAGRGRMGRRWISPKGGLWFSIILKPKLKPPETVKLVFLASLAVAETLQDLYGLKVGTKWPNDVLVDGRKVCGILSEMKTVGDKVAYAVIGIGINANFKAEKALPKELRETATSLETLLGRKIVLEELFTHLLEKMEAIFTLFLREGFNPILERWKKYASFLGCEVEILGEGEKLEGIAMDVDGDGALVLKLKDGAVRRVFVGDLSLKIKRQT
ncbi:MAG: biotin--[acetyl-CoA-carboxylase] ligase [Candidatus Bathyarchaeia archaeon]